MSNFSLWGLILSAGVLAYMTARWEAWVFYQQQKLNKTLLTLIRLATGILLVGLFTTSLTLPHWCMSLLMMMGVFGPTHRLTLNLTRMTKYRDRNRTIKWYSLNKGLYDSFWMLLGAGSEKRSFLIACFGEVFVAILASFKLSPF